METLDRRVLTLAAAERQLLAQRHQLTAVEALTHLVGLQAQEPLEPYVGLWSRLEGFSQQELVDLLTDREVVRTSLMRRTIHLVTSADCLALRPVHETMLVARMRGTLGRALPGVDFDQLAAAGEPLFAESPRTLTDVGRALGDRWPDAKARDLGDALSSLVPLVQTPPRGVWGQQAPARNTTIRSWLGQDPKAASDTVDRLVLRYLRAYGPATSSDVRAWCGLTGLPAVIKRLRPMLRTYIDERGRELLDVPDGMLPSPDTVLPPRFLPAFDNAVLGYDDRSRIIDAAHRGLSVEGACFVLVDGRVSGVWTSSRSAVDGVTVRIRPLRPLDDAEQHAVVEEARRLAAFLGDGRPGHVELA